MAAETQSYRARLCARAAADGGSSTALGLSRFAFRDPRRADASRCALIYVSTPPLSHRFARHVVAGESGCGDLELPGARARPSFSNWRIQHRAGTLSRCLPQREACRHRAARSFTTQLHLTRIDAASESACGDREPTGRARATDICGSQRLQQLARPHTETGSSTSCPPRPPQLI